MKKVVLFIVLVPFIIGTVFYFTWREQEQQALFNVHTLGRYIRAYEMIEGKKMTSLSDLPDVQIVSYGHGLKFESLRIRDRVFRGYYYDFQRIDERRFFILASPVRAHAWSKEFALLEDINLRVNVRDTGKKVYSYHDIRKWPVLPVQYDLRTVVKE